MVVLLQPLLLLKCKHYHLAQAPDFLRFLHVHFPATPKKHYSSYPMSIGPVCQEQRAGAWSRQLASIWCRGYL